MNWGQIFRTRVDRLIASGRLILSIVSLLAIWLDPSQPSRYAPYAYVLLAVYVACAAVFALRAWRYPVSGQAWAVASHGMDLALAIVLMHLTAGPTSPFFVFFTFSMLSATVRWRWQGAVLTCSVALALFAGMSIYVAATEPLEALDLNRVIVRGVYLGVIGAMLAYVGAQQERIIAEIARLTGWNQAITPVCGTPAGNLIEHAASVFGSRGALMLWEEGEEPWIHLCRYENGRVTEERMAPGSYEPAVHAALASRNFLCLRPRCERPTTLFHRGDRVDSWTGIALNPALLAMHPARSVLSLRLDTESMTGRLFIFDPAEPTVDHIVLGGIVASHVCAGMDRADLLGRLRRAAADEERIRMARDLHDGVLQALAGAGLHLQAVARMLADGEQGTGERLAAIQQLLETEQRELRQFIRRLESGAPGAQAQPDIQAELAPSIAHLQTRWGIAVTLSIEPADARLAPEIVQQTRHILNEAVANAARHGMATRIDLALRLSSATLALEARDDGHGFPVPGRHEHADLVARGIGPRSLLARVASLGGVLALDSSPIGTRIQITLPLTTLG